MRMMPVSDERVPVSRRPRVIVRLARLHYLLVVMSLIGLIAGWCCFNVSAVSEFPESGPGVVITDSRGIDREIQDPVLLTYSFAVIFAFAAVVGTGLLRSRGWARKWSWYTPLVTLPLWVPIVWDIARGMVSSHYGYTSTDPAFMGRITPITYVRHAAVEALMLWAAISTVYWLILRSRGVRDAFTSSAEVRTTRKQTRALGIGIAAALLLLLINFRVSDGRMFIHDAADYGWTSVVAILSHTGQSVNARTRNGRTPLHYAAASGRLHTVEYLLDHGADINARDREGHAPAATAGEGVYSLWDGHNRDCYRVLFYLIKRGADVKTNAHDIAGGVGVVSYLPGYPRALMRELVEHGFPANTSHTMLSLAVERGQPRDIDYLLSHGARMFPSLAGYADPKNLAHLLRRGFDVNARDEDGKTALYYTLDHDIGPNEGKACARLLVKHGADIRARDNEGHTPLGMADEDWELTLTGD